MRNSFNKFAQEAFVDVYDEDVAKIGRAYQAAMDKYKGKTNSYANLAELAKYLEDEMHKVGYRAYVDISPILLGEPPILEILGPIDEGKETDHDRKVWEVEKSKTRNEKFYGEKGKIA